MAVEVAVPAPVELRPTPPLNAWADRVEVLVPAPALL